MFSRTLLRYANFLCLGANDAFTALGMGAVIMRASPANDKTSVYVSDTDVYTDAATLAVGCTTAYALNSPLTNAMFGQALLQFGIVSYGLRIKYIGPAQAMTGYYVLYEQPSHSDVSTMTPTQVMADTGAVVAPVSPDWTSLVWSGPVVSSEYEYNSNPDTWPVKPQLCILIRGVGPDNTTGSQNFLIEGFANFELQGSGARGQQYSEFDFEGAGQVSQAIRMRARGGAVVNPPNSHAEAEAWFAAGNPSAISGMMGY